MYCALDLVDGYYQLLMQAIDIPLTAVSTPSSMLWEWMVMPQVLYNAPATFNRLVTQLFCPHRDYAQKYFDDIFVHSCAEKVGQISKITSVICEPCSSACALMNCTPTHLDAL